MLRQLQLGDGIAMHLIGAISQTQCAVMRPQLREREIIRDTTGTVCLYRPVDDLLRDIRCQYLDHGDFSFGDFVANSIHHVRRFQYQ